MFCLTYLLSFRFQSSLKDDSRDLVDETHTIKLLSQSAIQKKMEQKI